MAEQMTVMVHTILEDGLPDMDKLTGRVAFIWDGAIVSGWPLNRVGNPEAWEPAEDAMGHGPFYGVTHWVEFPTAIWNIERARTEPEGGDQE